MLTISAKIAAPSGPRRRPDVTQALAPGLSEETDPEVPEQEHAQRRPGLVIIATGEL